MDRGDEAHHGADEHHALQPEIHDTRALAQQFGQGRVE
jgi:hypothetical protein